MWNYGALNKFLELVVQIFDEIKLVILNHEILKLIIFGDGFEEKCDICVLSPVMDGYILRKKMLLDVIFKQPKHAHVLLLS